MRSVNIHDAKTHFSRLVDEVAAGDTVVIAKAGTPVARLVPLDESADQTKSLIGFLEGRVAFVEDFDRIGGADLADLFDGE